MKIRIKDASIRLRLSQKDMDQLDQEKLIVSRCPIGPDSIWTYQLAAREIEEAQVEMLANGIAVTIPLAAAESLIGLKTVGHSFIIDNGEPKNEGRPLTTLTLLIERDFKCLVDRPDEDESGLFPNPLAQ